jgi:predicted amidohydrolase
MRGLTIAAIQPRSETGPREHENADAAVEWVRRAADAGADLVVFPEGYPGPTNPANHYEGIERLSEASRRSGVHVIGGTIEAATDGRHRVTLSLLGDDGATLATYRRTTPRGPYVYRDIDAWAFEYVEADEIPRVVETRLARIGMLVCSELYVPELSRLLALDGADLIVYPAGGAINELLPGWRALVWARAIENLVYTSATQNLYGDEEGVGTIAGPEGVLAASAGAGMLLATLDLDRLAYLRAEDEHIVFPKPYAAIPGVLRWRRPDLYGALADSTVPEEVTR